MSGPEKGLSSYDKICKHLRQTQDFADFADKCFRIMDAANVCGWEFRLGGSEMEGTLGVKPPEWQLLIDWGKYDTSDDDVSERLIRDGKDRIEKVAAEPGKWLFTMQVIASDASLNKIVERNFGTKTCRTYFCKKDKVMEKWPSYARHALRENLLDKIARTEEKLRQSMIDALRSEAFDQDRTTFFERGIAEDIKKVLLKYASVAKPHVLKMALDEFVAHEIMES